MKRETPAGLIPRPFRDEMFRTISPEPALPALALPVVPVFAGIATASDNRAVLYGAHLCVSVEKS